MREPSLSFFLSGVDERGLPDAPAQGRRGALLLALLVFAVGLAGALSAWYALRAAEQDALAQRFADAQRLVMRGLDGELAAREKLLLATAGMIASSDEISAVEWQVFSQHLDFDLEHDGVVAIGYAPQPGSPVADAAALRKPAQIYAPGIVGHSVAEQSEQLRALQAIVELARDRDANTLSQLLIEPDGHGGTRERMFLMHPVFPHAAAATLESRRANLLGVSYLEFEPAIMLASASVGLDDAFAVRVRTAAEDGAHLLYQSAPGRAALEGGLAHRMDIEVGGRRWDVEVVQIGASGHLLSPATLALVGGLVIALLAGALTLLLGTARQRAEERARAMTADLRESERSLREYKEFLNSVIEGLPNPVVLKDDTLRVQLANPAFGELVGKPLSGIVGRRADALFPPEVAQQSDVLDRRLLDRGQSSLYEFSLGSTPEDEHFFQSRGVLLVGTTPQVLSVFTDVTAIRKQEQAVRHYKDMLEHLLEVIPTPLWIVDADARFVRINRAFSEAVGRVPTKVLRCRIGDLFPPELAQLADERNAYLMEHGGTQTVEVRLPDPAGQLRHYIVRKSVLQGLEGQPQVVSVASDVTEVRAQERLVRTLIDHLPQRVYAKDADGRFLLANQALARDLGVSSARLVGRLETDLMPGESADRWRADEERVMRADEVEVVETYHDQRWWRSTRVPMHDESGQLIGLVGIFDDITEHKLAQLALAESETRRRERLQTLVREQTTEALAARDEAQRANRVKSEFLANMSHELRTPMHAILSFAKLGEARASGTAAKLGEYFNRVRVSGERLLALLNDLLDLAKLEAGRMPIEVQPVDLIRLVDDAAREFEALYQSLGLHLVVVCDSAQTATRADPMRVAQVLRNLLSNAAKFSAEGGEVRVTVDTCRISAEETGGDAVDNPDGVEVVVSDQGIGIPPSELEAVFDKFVQSSKTRTGAGGTGLGLAICREIIEAHGGRIFARNRKGGGTEFVVRLPAADAMPASPQQIGE